MPGLTLARSNTPDWYKNVPADPTEFKRLPRSLSIKSCMPMLDAFTSGYTLALPMDIAVEYIDGFPHLTWTDGTITLVEERPPSSAPNFPVPMGCHTAHLTWKTLIAMHLPKGYSFFISHPFNRFDLPFTTLTGVVDADSILGPGNLPFFIKNGFEGVIPAGTPIAQILPFKREDWKIKSQEGLFKKGLDEVVKSTTSAKNYWKKHHWVKKKYD